MDKSVAHWHNTRSERLRCFQEGFNGVERDYPFGGYRYLEHSLGKITREGYDDYPNNQNPFRKKAKSRYAAYEKGFKMASLGISTKIIGGAK